MLDKLVVDIAYYTAGVDPIPLLEGDVQLMILKVDSLFERNGRTFVNAGMPIAAYHWIDPTRDAAQQVAQSLEVIRRSNLPVLAIFWAAGARGSKPCCSRVAFLLRVGSSWS